MTRARESLRTAPGESSVRDASELCPSCGEANDSTASECLACGRSLVLLMDSSTPAVGSRRLESGGSFWSGSGPVVEETLDYAPGEAFAGRYIIIDRLGQGGMGVVYKARDLELNRIVALKMIRSKLTENPESLERFRREPGLAQQVTHENVCRVHDLGVQDGVRYLSMEYLEANTLSDLVAKLGRLSVRQTLEIAVQVVSGLDAIHARGIVHRDLKPSNIAVDANRRAVVMDFGLARGPIDSELTAPGVLVGSYAYLAPEHIRGEELSVAVDIYALGLLLYEMLTGRKPPGDDDHRPLALRGNEAPCPPPRVLEPDVPAELDELIMRCLSWEPSERPASVSELLPTLEEALDEERARIKRRPVRAPISRARALAATLGVVAVAAAYTGLRGDGNGSDVNVVTVRSWEYEGSDADGDFHRVLAADAMAAGIQATPGFRLARNGASAWTLGGSVADDGDELVWRGRLANAHGRIVWEDTVRGVDALESLEELQRRLMADGFDVGEPTPFTTLRTDDLEAYRSFLEARGLHDGWYSQDGSELDRARSLYQRALRVDPEFALAHAGQAMASVGVFLRTRDAGDRAVAQYAASRALAYGSELPEAHLAEGTYLAAVEMWDEAAAAFARAFELAPEDDAALRNIASLYDTLGRPEDAHRLFELAIERAPESWENYYWYGRSLFRAGELDEAPLHLEKAVELNADADGPLTLLGFYHLSRGDLDQARALYQRALDLSGDLLSRRAVGLVNYYSGDFDEALEHWTRVLEAEPDVPIHHADVGDALRQLGATEDAAKHYATALSLYDQNPPPDPASQAAQTGERAQVLAALGRCTEAKSQMESVLGTHGHDTQYQYYGALTAARCGDVSRAVELVLSSIGGGSIVGIEFDPDLESVRKDPRVRRPLELIGLE